MKDKRHKYFEDLLDEHIELTDEQLETPLLIEKLQRKFDQHLSEEMDFTYKSSDAEHLFKYHNQLRKYKVREKEIVDELVEVENAIREFLATLKGGKVACERKDDNDKSKNTFVFWLEGDTVKCNR